MARPVTWQSTKGSFLALHEALGTTVLAANNRRLHVPTVDTTAAKSSTIARHEKAEVPKHKNNYW